ncbi:hypothetical protein QFC19_007941 [Naganishia cerealis]|uniref:Uncharacterized protein n=1 Tax=Naganishia cerealis TaxID=610337 RepID=A0ACC2V6P5_9TREE|nr:hypothetical protein QFC19_007941 [Naganishia cerealis]
MTFVGRLKIYLTIFVVLYTTYLFSYKCAKLNETAFEHGVEKVLHPLSHSHNQLCDGLNKGVNFATPYVGHVQKFLDDHVHSTKLFQDYKIHEKVVCAQGKYYKFVHPWVIRYFQLFEVAEQHVADHFVAQYGKVKGYLGK